MCKLNRILIGKTHPLNRTIVLLGRLDHTLKQTLDGTRGPIWDRLSHYIRGLDWYSRYM